MNGTVIAETVRRHATNVIYVIYVLFLCIVAMAVSRMDQPGFMWTSMLGLLALAGGAGLIGPEFSSGTLQLILVKPVNRATYLLSRWVGVVLSVWLAAWIVLSVEAIARLFVNSGDKIARAAEVTLNTSIKAMLTCAMLALFGTFLRAYFNVALYFVLEVGLSVSGALLDITRNANGGLFRMIGDFVADHPIIRKSLTWLTNNLYPAPPQRFDRAWVLLVATNAAIALVVACFIFRKREVPYGAD